MRILWYVLVLSLTLVFTSTALAADAPDSDISETSVSGATSAMISFHSGPDSDSGLQDVTNLKLRIERAGVVAIDAPLVLESCGEPSCRPFALTAPANAPRVLVRDIDVDDEPEILVGVFSGGAHCCTTLVVFDWNGAEYTRVVEDFLDSGISLRNLDKGRALEMLTYDARYAYVFTSYAESWKPVQVKRFQGGAVIDVSKQFPFLLKQDAFRALKAARQQCKAGPESGSTIGLYTGWAADQYRLGLRLQTIVNLRNEAKRSCLFPTINPSATIVKIDRFVRSVK